MEFNLQKAVQQKYLPAGFYTAIELSHSKFNQVYRLVNNTAVVDLGGLDFEPYPLNFTPKSQGDNSVNSLVLSNVDQSVVKELVKAKDDEDIKVKVWFVILEEKDDNIFKEYEYAGKYIVSSVSVNKNTTSVSLDLDTSLKFNIGTIRFNNPNIFYNLNRT